MRVGIVGLGLVGGSLGAALRRAGYEVRGHDQQAARAERALARGLVDALSAPVALGAWAELVVLAVPVEAMAAAALSLEPPPALILTDVGSTKVAVQARLEAALGPRLRYVPGHPMAGGEQSGPEAARAELFEGRVTLLGPAPDPEAGEAVEGLWRAAGARTRRLSLEEQDALCALSSHLPHLLAFAYARASLEGAAARPGLFSLGGESQRALLRLAGSDPALWRGIFLDNQGPLTEALDAFDAALAPLRAALAAEDGPALEAAIAAGAGAWASLEAL